MHVFDIRDSTLGVLRDGGYELSPTAAALLWFLLFHGIYDRGSKWYGHVNIQMCGQDTLSIAVRRHRKAVGLGLAELEATGFIKRHRRYHPEHGNRLPDGIELTTPDDFCYACRKRGHDENNCPGPMGENHP